jgi:alkaline phosphatase D
MGRPVHSKPRPAGTNRRDFFRRSGSAAAALASVSLLPLGATAAGPVFQHGVASGDPLADRVILWTRVTVATTKAVAVDYIIATDPALTQVVQRGSTKATAPHDFTVHVDAEGLQPGTTYYYAFMAAGATSPTGRTRTLPVGSTPRLRIAVVSCSNHAYGYFNAYRRIAERADLDLVLHLGDYLYEYGSGQYGNVRPTEPPTEILTLTDYRTRHAQYKRDADAQEMHRQHPMIAIWDDHETANNSYRDGAENHTEGVEGTWVDRVNGALQAYHEWMPVRQTRPKQPRYDQRAFALGDLVQLVMLEERLQARSEQLPATLETPLGLGFVQAGDFADPSRTLLGPTQESWLASQLRKTPAKWKLLGQGVMFAQLKAVAGANKDGGGVFLNPDQWDGYQPARDRVYDILKGAGGKKPVDNVVVLTGDIHSSWAADLTQDPNNPDVPSGGYDPATGAGSRAVEFVGTSVSSPGIDDPTGATAAYLNSVNPQFKYIELNYRGYMLLDIDPNRVVGEWWYVDTVATPSPNQSFGKAFEVRAGTNHLVPSSQTLPRADPPPLAP